MLTPDGVALVATLLEGGRMLVTDGSRQRAEAPLTEVRVDGRTITVTATFGENDANFDWRNRIVLAKDGKGFDADVADMGRKAGGHEWTAVATIDFSQE